MDDAVSRLHPWPHRCGLPGERRGTGLTRGVSAARPSHSALTGMMAAALGLTRTIRVRDGLGRSIGLPPYASMRRGRDPIVDYHTTQDTRPGAAQPALPHAAVRRSTLAEGRSINYDPVAARIISLIAAFTVAAIVPDAESELVFRSGTRIATRSHARNSCSVAGRKAFPQPAAIGLCHQCAGSCRKLWPPMMRRRMLAPAR